MHGRHHLVPGIRLLLLLLGPVHALISTPRIAVVGGGIGGAAAAHYTSILIPRSEVVLLEASARVGGRAFSLVQDGVRVELGGTFFNPKLNPTLHSLIEAVDAPTVALFGPLSKQDVYIWNGTNTLLKLRHGHYLADLLADGAEYGLPASKALLEAAKFRKVLADTLDELGKPDVVYHNISELLGLKGLDSFCRQSTQSLLKSTGVGQRFIDNVMSAVTNVIYTQGVGASSMIGMSELSMLSTPPSVSTTVNGNDDLVQRLLKQSGCTVRLRQLVQRIERHAFGKGFAVDVNGTVEQFDAVIVATPIERAVGMQISPALPVRKFAQVHVTVVTARGLDSGYFGQDMAAGSFVIAPSQSSIESDIHLIWNNNKTAEGASVYLLHSKQVVSQDTVSRMFIEPSTVSRHHWQEAYPLELPTTQVAMPPVIVVDGLYYVNSIETVASSMETSALGARNAVKMLARWWNMTARL